MIIMPGLKFKCVSKSQKRTGRAAWIMPCQLNTEARNTSLFVRCSLVQKAEYVCQSAFSRVKETLV